MDCLGDDFDRYLIQFDDRSTFFDGVRRFG